ncbi:MAG: response regulator transcription factor [Desulfovibrio sp.]|uniref:response regulator transcription factor n=1 Tax=Desulfovibrio sp. 7SRBS1 TaxID=3378064 RepID=UPI003B3D73C2
MTTSIVIVEDENLERQAIRTILNNELKDPCEMLEASTGLEAIKIIDSGGVDLMLLDISIPRPNGLEVLRYLRENNHHSKVIITTAHDDFNMAREAINLKADGYLLKPIRVQALVEAVQSCLGTGCGTGRRCEELAQAVYQYLAQNMYQDSVILVRNHLNWIYAQDGGNIRQLLLETGDALVKMGQEKDLDTDCLRGEIDRVRNMNTGSQNWGKVLDTYLRMLDCLFESTRKYFGHSQDTMQRVLGYIERFIYKGVTLEEAAEFGHVSPSYLSRLFKKSTGENFVSYTTRLRMEQAKELLKQSDLPITAIALELSYNDVQYFYKSFKKMFGMSPSEYRKQASAETCATH